MNEAIINSIFAISGTLLGIILSLLGITITLFIQKRNTNRDNLKRENDNLKSDIKYLARQGMMLYDLEKEYLNEWVTKFPDKKIDNVKKEFRKKVNEKNEDYIINLTENRAKDILSKYF
ncbi:MAG: hypothetical protein FWD09_05795 [Lentimicrobiaceae bacterium]|nr:hypothetical protein [Lentimicrobiaceae bacterium]